VRILGIDCGTITTGYGVVESDGVRHRLVEAGVIKAGQRGALPERLLVIGRRLREVVAEFGPEEAAVEDVFTRINVRSALALTHARGVVLYILAEAGVPVTSYAPARVKAAVTGSGRAAKEQIQWLLPSLLGLAGTIDSPDAADAVAVALCHATLRRAGIAE
jgi:crossover junction endodeoxyribonuclease RuvC